MKESIQNVYRFIIYFLYITFTCSLIKTQQINNTDDVQHQYRPYQDQSNKTGGPIIELLASGARLRPMPVPMSPPVIPNVDDYFIKRRVDEPTMVSGSIGRRRPDLELMDPIEETDDSNHDQNYEEQNDPYWSNDVGDPRIPSPYEYFQSPPPQPEAPPSDPIPDLRQYRRPIRYAPDDEVPYLINADGTSDYNVPVPSDNDADLAPKPNLPELKSTFLKDILDFLFRNRSKMVADIPTASSNGGSNDQLPVFRVMTSTNDGVENVRNVDVAGELRPLEIAMSKRDSQSIPNRPTNVQPSPLLQKHLDNLSDLLKLEESQDVRHKLKNNLLNELSMPVLIKPIIIAVPEAKKTDNPSNADTTEQSTTVKNKENNDDSKMDYNTIQIPPSSNSGIPNTWHVYGKHNYLILQNAGNQKNLSKTHNDGVGDDDNEVKTNEMPLKTRHIDYGIDPHKEKNIHLDSLRSCNCEVKCHNCKAIVEEKNPKNRVVEVTSHDNNIMRRSASSTNQHNPIPPVFLNRMPRPTVDKFNRNSLPSSASNQHQRLSFDSPMNDVDGLASDATRYFDIGDNGDLTLDDIDGDLQLKTDAVKSYIDSLNSRLSNTKESEIIKSIESIDENSLTMSPNEIDDFIESHVENQEKHNIVKKYLSSNDLPDAVHLDEIY